jgi:hypothetical protein
MGRTACTGPQCLYSRVIPLLPLWTVRPVQSLSNCIVELYLYSPYGPYGLYRASMPVQRCTLPSPLPLPLPLASCFIGSSNLIGVWRRTVKCRDICHIDRNHEHLEQPSILTGRDCSIKFWRISYCVYIRRALVKVGLIIFILSPCML